MYSPLIGQFAERDPLGYAAGDENLYRYVGGNSITNTDPFGLVKFDPPIRTTFLKQQIDVLEADNSDGRVRMRIALPDKTKQSINPTPQTLLDHMPRADAERILQAVKMARPSAPLPPGPTSAASLPAAPSWSTPASFPPDAPTMQGEKVPALPVIDYPIVPNQESVPRGHVDRPGVIRVQSQNGAFQIEAWGQSRPDVVNNFNASLGVIMSAKYFLRNSSVLLPANHYDVVVAERFLKPGSSALFDKLYHPEVLNPQSWSQRGHAMDPATGFRITTRNVNAEIDLKQLKLNNHFMVHIGTVSPPQFAATTLADDFSNASEQFLFKSNPNPGYDVEYLLGVKCMTQNLKAKGNPKWLDATLVKFAVRPLENGSVRVLPSIPGIPPNAEYPLKDSVGIYGFQANQSPGTTETYSKWLQGAAAVRFDPR